MGRLYRYLSFVSVYVLVLLFCSPVYAIGPHELPFGVYTTRDSILMDTLGVVRDSLGINFIYGQVGSGNVAALKDSSIDMIFWGNDYQGWLSGTTYLVAQAEEGTSPIDFKIRQGSDGIPGFLTSADSGMMLDRLQFNQYTFSCNPADTSNPFQEYHAAARLRIDPTGLFDTSLIGVIYAKRLDSVISDVPYWSIRAADSIFAGSHDTTGTDSLLTGDTLYVNGSLLSYWLGGSGDPKTTYRVNYSFWNSGRTTVFLDYLKFYDAYGKLLNETDYYDDSIAVAITGGWKDTVSYWWLRDEPKFDHFTSWGKTKAVVDSVKTDSTSIGALCLSCIRDTYDTTDFRKILDSFYSHTGQNKLICNDYPFWGGYGTSGLVTYAGYFEENMEPGNPHSVRGMQMELIKTSQNILDAFRAKAERSPGFEFWYSPQWFYAAGSEDESPPPDTRYQWRPPTRSELRMQIWLGLCYGARGINFWRYDPNFSDPGWGKFGPDNCTWQGGLIDSINGRVGPDTMKWNLLKNELTPRIKAIDSLYLSLKWSRAFPFHKDKPNFPAPSASIISDISARSNRDKPNTDLGWFHIGEFAQDGSNDKYAIILNRACSQGKYNSKEAPSIEATIKFNSRNLDFGRDVLIIDLSKKVSWNSRAHDWQSYPDTTHVSIRNGVYSYTTTLQAGEGRLFKIAKANSR